MIQEKQVQFLVSGLCSWTSKWIFQKIIRYGCNNKRKNLQLDGRTCLNSLIKITERWLQWVVHSVTCLWCFRRFFLHSPLASMCIQSTSIWHLKRRILCHPDKQLVFLILIMPLYKTKVTMNKCVLYLCRIEYYVVLSQNLV